MGKWDAHYTRVFYLQLLISAYSAVMDSAHLHAAWTALQHGSNNHALDPPV